VPLGGWVARDPVTLLLILAPTRACDCLSACAQPARPCSHACRHAPMLPQQPSRLGGHSLPARLPLPSCTRSSIGTADRPPPRACCPPVQNTGTSLLETFSLDQIIAHKQLIFLTQQTQRNTQPPPPNPCDLCKVGACRALPGGVAALGCAGMCQPLSAQERHLPYVPC